MQRRKREREAGGLHVVLTPHQLLQSPVLPHRVVPTLLRRTVACYLPVFFVAPEDPADIDANAAETLGDIAVSTAQCRDAQRRQPRVLAELLQSVLVAKHTLALEDEKGAPECARVATAIDSTGSDQDTGSDTDDSDVWSDDLWTESPGVDCLEMAPSKVELARALLPAAVRYERWLHTRSEKRDELPCDSYVLSVTIEGMRVVAVASLSKATFDEDVVEGEHFFAEGPIHATFDDSDGPSWDGATFTATSELEFRKPSRETRTRAYGSLEAAGSAARALLFPKSPLRVFTDRELGFLVALAVTVEGPGQRRLDQGRLPDHRAVAAPGLIRGVLYRLKVPAN